MSIKDIITKYIDAKMPNLPEVNVARAKVSAALGELYELQKKYKIPSDNWVFDLPDDLYREPYDYDGHYYDEEHLAELLADDGIDEDEIRKLCKDMTAICGTSCIVWEASRC